MIVYFLAVVYCNRDSKLEISVILPALLSASPLQAPSKSRQERKFEKYVNQTYSCQKCCLERSFVKEVLRTTICKKSVNNDNLQYLHKHDFEQNNKEIVQSNLHQRR